VTLEYGPFNGRWYRVLIALLVGTVAIAVAFINESSMFRALECTRPGVCTVVVGGPIAGPHVERRFDPSSVIDVKKERTSGKGAHDLLVLVDREGGERVLFDGDAVAPEYERTRDFFTSTGERTFAIHAPLDATMTGILSSIAAASIAVAIVLAIAGLRAGVRFRVSILRSQGVLRIERMAGGRPRDARDARLADVMDVSIVTKSGARAGRFFGGPARVVIHLRIDPDMPICPRFLAGAHAHAEVASELRRELGLPEANALS
jgi:hypothetical protein